MHDSTTETIINTIKDFNAQIQQSIPTDGICHIQSDAGSQFLSNKVQQYCIDNNIKSTVAASKYQEINAYCEDTWSHTGFVQVIY